MKTIKDFTNIYQLSKTLRFALIPQGKTLEHFNNSKLFDVDKQRAEDYKIVKKIADNYHKYFMENALADCLLNVENKGENNSIAEFYDSYKKGKDDKETFTKIADNLRKQVVKAFSTQTEYKLLDKKDLIETILPSFENDAENIRALNTFKGFTTYFSGYNTVRKNLYSADEKQSSIAYRLINQNLPKFINNIEAFKKIANSSVAESFAEITKAFEFYLSVDNITEMFELDYYNIVLTQTQIEVYNAIIGGKTQEDGTKIQGINEHINLYNQQQKADKSKRLPLLKPLYKQLLSDREAISWLPESFSSDKDMLEGIQQGYELIREYVLNKTSNNPIPVIELLENIKDYNIDKIYITNDTQLTSISKKHLGDWSIIKNAIRNNYEQNNPITAKENLEKFEKRATEYEEKLKNISLSFVNNLFCNTDDVNINKKNICDYFGKENSYNITNKIKINYETAFATLNSTNNILQKDRVAATELIKNLLDSLKELQFFIKPLVCDLFDKDEDFYGILLPQWEVLNETLNPLYNKVRNYLTKKPYSTEKIKLNFKNQTLLNGWALSKEEDNTCILFRKQNNFYLGIMNKQHNKVFRNPPVSNNHDCFEKMEYQLLPGANKMLPKVFFSKKNINFYAPSKQILENYTNETHKKGANFNINHCHALIDFFKESINKNDDWRNFGFKFSDTKSYADLSGFYREVEAQGYSVKFKNIPTEYINTLVDEGKLYLFQIYNKDFSEYSKGKPNLHTMYWRALFDENNLSNVVYKLNGEAEVFFRKQSLKYSDEIMQKGHHYNSLKDKFDYPIIKDRRYSCDKFLFHVPITMNFKARGFNNINPLVADLIKNNGIEHIIGIDRGERHLLYLSLIDTNGNIKQQFSLNTILNTYKGQTHKTDYLGLLKDKESKRMDGRKSWTEVETIKELKEGYISQVIHKVVQLMIEYKAIVVMEDLNMGFKRGRQKVESSVYQKFEKMLIDKLNYVVNKDTEVTQTGGVLNAYQFANKFESFVKLGKQSGFIFYVPAWNTSNIDPATGFVNLLYPKFENIEKTKEFINTIDNIRYNSKANYFEFDVDYSKFKVRAESHKKQWTICTHGTRIINFRDSSINNQWNYKTIDLTAEFKTLFESVGINISSNIKESINSLAINKQEFYKSFMNLLKTTLQMRNSNPNQDLDYIISPVANAQGVFFDSRNNDTTLPENADANGAYNIALKGLWATEQIKNNNTDKPAKLAISNKEWLEFVQSRV